MGQLELEVGFVCMGKVGHREVVERIFRKTRIEFDSNNSDLKLLLYSRD